jgi:uncharacterized protein
MLFVNNIFLLNLLFTNNNNNKMDALTTYSQRLVNNTELTFTRYLYKQIVWEDRLIGITGARGTGKTTILLQYLKNNYKNSPTALYISLDDFYFTKYRLFEVAENFYNNGGRILIIDEVHKYKGWSVEIKNLYDIFHDLKIVFSGSSALQIHLFDGDLSRRAAIYHLHELSFREYLQLKNNTYDESYTLEEIIHNHLEISEKITKKEAILPLFKQYMEYGVYPFFIEAKGQYHQRLVNTVNVIIENDLVMIDNISFHTSLKLKKVLMMIADSVPFKINISEISRKSELSRDLLLNLLHSLERAGLIKGIRQKSAPTGHLTKPEKIYINNTALLYALNTNETISLGTLRETFFMNQLSLNHQINTTNNGDFLINNKYTFEIGGKNKTGKQIANLKNAYVVADEIEYGYTKTIPLWMFGFLY